ncbi:hypothetical protein ACET3Z_005008 [Daucus carota]
MEEDVYEVLGLPCGRESITLGTYDYYRSRIDEWSAQFKTERESTQVTVAKLVQLIKNQGLTQNFKFNFLLVLSNVLIGTPTYSYIDRQMLRLHGNLDECYRYNWAKFLIGYLVSATRSWNENASSHFRGSAIFLTNAKGNDKGKDVPNQAWDDWNAHQNDDILWDEWEKAQRQSVANETNDRENVHDTEQHIQVEEQDDHGQASGEKDVVESLRSWLMSSLTLNCCLTL